MAGQAKGSATRLAFDSETTFGVAKTTGQAAIVLPFTSEDLEKKQGMEQSAVIRGNRNPSQAFLGSIDVSGNITVPVRSDLFGHLLKMAIGVPATTGTGPTYTHVFKIDDLDSLPSMVIEKAYLDLATPYYELYKGCKINTLGIKVGPTGELLATLGILGASMAGSETAYDASPSAVEGYKFMMFDAAAKEGGNAITTLKEWSLDYSNDLDGDTVCIGAGGARGSLPEGTAIVKGSINALFMDKSLLVKADGATESSLEIEFNPSGSTDNLKIQIPELTYEPASAKVSGPKGVMLNLNYSGFYANDAAASAIVVTLINSTESYA